MKIGIVRFRGMKWYRRSTYIVVNGLALAGYLRKLRHHVGEYGYSLNIKYRKSSWIGYAGLALYRECCQTMTHSAYKGSFVSRMANDFRSYRMAR